MLSLPLRAKRLVLSAAVRAALIWAVPVIAVLTSPWLYMWNRGAELVDLGFADAIRLAVIGAGAAVVVFFGLVLAFPHERFGDWVVRRIGEAGGQPSTRAVNLADQLGLATGERRHRVMVLASPVPNVAAIPGREGTTVVVTSGADQRLPRDDLEALMATQVVVASDRWVRTASAAQLVSGPRFALLFGAGFLNPVLIPLAFLAFMGHRRGDAVRDMVADSAALRATRHPEALSRALYELRPAAPHANALRVGLPGVLVDQYWVLSRRSKVTTTVSGPTGSRQWTTTEEIAAEMAMRADRVLRGSRGDLRALFDLRSWKRAVKGLGRDERTPAGFPIPLTPEEQAQASEIGSQLA